MQIEQLMWNTKNGWQKTLQASNRDINPQLALFFGESSALESGKCYFDLRDLYPNAHIIGCTSAGEIIGEGVYDGSVVVSAVDFENTPISIASISISTMADSFRAGAQLGKELKRPGLRAALVISEGIRVNGSELVRGIVSTVGDNIPVTGGLAGDGTRFQMTRVGCDSKPEPGRIAGIGFYGPAITIGYGSASGWDPFGPERHITRSKGNILYELDGKPALELYKRYLGEEADNLPASALLFPLMVYPANNKGSGIVRSVLSVSEDDQSMTFAGDIPQGYTAQLMRANFDCLIDGAEAAAKIARERNKGNEAKLAILISCVGRKMVLGQRIADEVEAVHEILGHDVAQIGFYSYGGISPHVSTGICELHNQTMTITLISE